MSRAFSAALLAALMVVGCKNKSAPRATAEPATSASSSASAKPRPVQPPVVGKDVRVVRCELGPNVPGGSNGVAATRHLHRGPDDSLYFFPDFNPPTRLEPTKEGCGYKVAAPIVVKPNYELGLEPDGSFKEYSVDDDRAIRRCRVRAFDKLRYGHGRLHGKTFFYVDHDELQRTDLASETCAPEPVKLAAYPNAAGARPSLGLSGDDLLVRIGRSEWKWNSEIFRYDRELALVRRYGKEDKEHAIVGDADGCGDGLCTLSGQAWLAIHDRDGKLVKEFALGQFVKPLEEVLASRLVDIPGKGVYVLIGYKLGTGGENPGRAELLRLDGIH